MAGVRLIQLLLDRGLVDSTRQARGLIMTGQVWVDERRMTKPGMLCAPQVAIRVVDKKHPWVSRGGIKLAHAMDRFDLSVVGAACLDVGASTGGFTEVLLDRGARRVFAVDVGYGQLAWKLVQDPRVVVLDRTNIRRLDAALVPEPVDALTMDVSFISLAQALPPALAFLRMDGLGVVLLKPQFELPRHKISPGGVVQDPALHREAYAGFERLADGLGLRIDGAVPSPIVGSKGNREFLCLFSRMPKGGV